MKSLLFFPLSFHSPAQIYEAPVELITLKSEITAETTCRWKLSAETSENKTQFFWVKQIEKNLVSLKNVWNNICLSEWNLLTELPEECLNSKAHRDTKNVEQTRTVDHS